MKKLVIFSAGLLLMGLTACDAPATGTDTYDGDNTETEREGMETNEPENTRTEEDATMEEKYRDGSDEDPVADSLPAR